MNRRSKCGRAAGPAVRVDPPPAPPEKISPAPAETPPPAEPSPEDTAFEVAQSQIASTQIAQAVTVLMQAGIARATVLKCLVGTVVFITPKTERPASQMLLAAAIGALDAKAE